MFPTQCALEGSYRDEQVLLLCESADVGVTYVELAFLAGDRGPNLQPLFADSSYCVPRRAPVALGGKRTSSGANAPYKKPRATGGAGAKVCAR